MDGVSAAASVIAVIQISAKVFDLCRKYHSEVRDARKDIQRLRDEVTSLQDVLTNIADLADAPAPDKLSNLDLLNQSDGPLRQCQAELEGLEAKLEERQGKDKMKQFGLRALQWPYSSKDVDKAIMAIGRHKATFNLALTADHVRLSQAMKGEIDRLRDGVTEVQIGQDIFLTEQRRQKIHEWLSAPDPSFNHNAACKKRQATTGSWFTSSKQFADWKKDLDSFLWLYGIPGCGKTILTSTIVEDLIECRHLRPKLAVVYFYFDFSDTRKRLHDSMIRSLILQLSLDCPSGEPLTSLFSSYGNEMQQPTVDALLTTLRQMIDERDETFIILDALDECGDRQELLGHIEEIATWRLGKLHMLFTSRREKDIEDSLSPLVNEGQSISIQSVLVDEDIRAYIHERVQTDPGLRRWQKQPHVQEEIETELGNKANGMFRWAVCQLDALQRCLSLRMLRKALASLPKTLDDTYARILCSIDEEYSQDAFKILQWLAFSTKPLSIRAVAEVIAADVEGTPLFDPERRLPEPQDILTICSSLVSIADETIYGRLGNTVESVVRVVRLAHFSVKEYLVSERIQAGLAAKYSIREIHANICIAETCLAYLLQFDEQGCSPLQFEKYSQLAVEAYEKFPLIMYAASNWTEHARVAEKATDCCDTLALLSMTFFMRQGDAYVNWIRLSMYWDGDNIASPLYYISLLGLLDLTRLLLDSGADTNAKGGVFGAALQAAAYTGSEALVRLLLDRGADINAEGGMHGTALQAAAYNGSEALVRLLLDRGADINAEGGGCGTALQAAACNGFEALVRLFLDRGAEINAEGGHFGSALQAAAYTGSEALVRLLLDRGTDINAKGGIHGAALQAAAYNGFEAVVRLLLDRGADINAKGGSFGTALQAAAYKGSEVLVRLLLDRGADINTEGGEFGAALQAAAYNGSEAVVRLLLDRGADINAKGGSFSTALQVAVRGDHKAVVRLLFDRGADINDEVW